MKCGGCGWSVGHDRRCPLFGDDQWETMRRESTAVLFPKFKDGFIVIDITDAPRLANAIGARIHRRRHAADAAMTRARMFLTSSAANIQVVPVDGPSEYFATPFILADAVTVNERGLIVINGGRA